MNDHPILLLLMLSIGSYVGLLWCSDYLAARKGAPNRGALPGSVPCGAKALGIAISGALSILALETYFEVRLDLAAEQSRITILFGAYTLVAAFIEELIFRGYLVIDNKSPAARWTAALAASVLFAALHPFLWQWDDDGFRWMLNTKGWFSTLVVFMSSLWFYTVRFASFNPTHSLLPCIAAHAAKNLGVIVIKAAQGFVAGWW